MNKKTSSQPFQKISSFVHNFMSYLEYKQTIEKTGGDVFVNPPLRPSHVDDKGKGKGKGQVVALLDTALLTCDQKRFKVAADWHELMIPQRTMQPSIARSCELLCPRCSLQTYHRCCQTTSLQST